MTAPPPTNCANASVAAYVPDAGTPWNLQRAQHLYRRIQFGANFNVTQGALSEPPAALIDSIIDAAITTPNMAPFPWSFNVYDDYLDAEGNFDYETTYNQYWELRSQWEADFISKGLKEKMTLFWSNHFVTAFGVYACTPAAFNYLTTLQTYALGNFKDLVHAIGLTPAMLVYLDGQLNVKDDPNENYARELYELFTLGVNNGYDQDDINNTAHALTGYRTDDCISSNFHPDDFDNGYKTIFGQTGFWGYDDVINILFQERAIEISEYICIKIYKYFVNDIVNKNFTSILAETFRNNNWEIAPVLRQLFKSEHFFDSANIGVKIKEPVQLVIGTSIESNPPGPVGWDGMLQNAMSQMEQDLLSPPDVAGWTGYRSWINSNTIATRWDQGDNFANFYLWHQGEGLRQLAVDVSNNSSDVSIIAQSLVDYFLPNGLNTLSSYNTATNVLKSDVPQNYYDNGYWDLTWGSVPNQVRDLLQWIFRQPEYQLH